LSLFVWALAISWHVCSILIERSRRSAPSPPIKKILWLAEMDMLSAIRGELIHLLHKSPDEKLRQKLAEVEKQLKRAGDNFA